MNLECKIKAINFIKIFFSFVIPVKTIVLVFVSLAISKESNTRRDHPEDVRGRPSGSSQPVSHHVIFFEILSNKKGGFCECLYMGMALFFTGIQKIFSFEEIIHFVLSPDRNAKDMLINEK